MQKRTHAGRSRIQSLGLLALLTLTGMASLAAADPMIPDIPGVQTGDGAANVAFQDHFLTDGLDRAQWVEADNADAHGRCGFVSPAGAVVLQTNTVDSLHAYLRPRVRTGPLDLGSGSVVSFWTHMGGADGTVHGLINGNWSPIEGPNPCGTRAETQAFAASPYGSVRLLLVPQYCYSQTCETVLWLGTPAQLLEWDYVEARMPAHVALEGAQLEFVYGNFGDSLSYFHRPAWVIDDVVVQSAVPATGVFDEGTPIPVVEWDGGTGVKVVNGREHFFHTGNPRLEVVHQPAEDDGRTLFDSSDPLALPIVPPEGSAPDLRVMVDGLDSGRIDPYATWDDLTLIQDWIAGGSHESSLDIYDDRNHDGRMDAGERILSVDPGARTSGGINQPCVYEDLPPITTDFPEYHVCSNGNNGLPDAPTLQAFVNSVLVKAHAYTYQNGYNAWNQCVVDEDIPTRDGAHPQATVCTNSNYWLPVPDANSFPWYGANPDTGEAYLCFYGSGQCDASQPHLTIPGFLRPMPCGFWDGVPSHRDMLVGVCDDRNLSLGVEESDPILLAVPWPQELGPNPLADLFS